MERRGWPCRHSCARAPGQHCRTQGPKVRERTKSVPSRYAERSGACRGPVRDHRCPCRSPAAPALGPNLGCRQCSAAPRRPRQTLADGKAAEASRGSRGRRGSQAQSAAPLGDRRRTRAPGVSGARHAVLVDGPLRTGDALGPSGRSHRSAVVDALAGTHPRAGRHGAVQRRDAVQDRGEEPARPHQRVRPLREAPEGDASLRGRHSLLRASEGPRSARHRATPRGVSAPR